MSTQKQQYKASLVKGIANHCSLARLHLRVVRTVLPSAHQASECITDYIVICMLMTGITRVQEGVGTTTPTIISRQRSAPTAELGGCWRSDSEL